MTLLIDTSVFIDFLRGRSEAREVLEAARRDGPLHASEITRLEVLAGMRPHEEQPTRRLLDVLTWHPVSATISERAGVLGREWLPSHQTIASADLAIAATALELHATLCTLNTKHFPMFADLTPPY